MFDESLGWNDLPYMFLRALIPNSYLDRQTLEDLIRDPETVVKRIPLLELRQLVELASKPFTRLTECARQEIERRAHGIN